MFLSCSHKLGREQKKKKKKKKGKRFDDDFKQDGWTPTEMRRGVQTPHRDEVTPVGMG